MSPIQQMLLGVGAVATATYVDDLFNTDLYVGNGDTSFRTINNGINLNENGGLVWIKNRDGTNNHQLYDTERGGGKSLASNSSAAQVQEGGTMGTVGLATFNTTGFSTGMIDSTNKQGDDFTSFSFRKAPGFFDVVKWDGDGSSSTRQINHNLKSIPGMIIMKAYEHPSGVGNTDWQVYHRKLNGGVNPEQYALILTSGAEGNNTWFGDTAPTATHFTIGSGQDRNGTGGKYVAYLFAHDEQSFGEDANSSVIKCGSYTTDSNEDATINLGWEPQWVLAKRTDSSTGGDWMIVDSMRGFPNAQDVQDNSTGGTCKVLEANTTDTEANTSRLGITSTGFYADQFGSNRSFIYLAIRRPDGYVGKPPELGTGVFAMDTGAGSSTIPNFDSGFPVDWAIARKPSVSQNWFAGARLIQGNYLNPNTTGAATANNGYSFDSNSGWNSGGTDSSYQSWMWKRHAGFDVVCYDGTASAKNINHSLNKVPEMMWVKVRSRTGKWAVYHKDMGQGYGSGNASNFYMYLNETDARVVGDTNRWDGTTPTSSVFTVGTADDTNKSGHTLVAMLFASVDGISKVGSYTGNGSTTGPVITTGFAPRLIMIKRSSGDGDWYILDTVRGLSSSSNKLLKLNDDDAQSTPSSVYVEPSSTGFQLKVGYLHYNYNNENYIYYAHA